MLFGSPADIILGVKKLRKHTLEFLLNSTAPDLKWTVIQSTAPSKVVIPHACTPSQNLSLEFDHLSSRAQYLLQCTE